MSFKLDRRYNLRSHLLVKLTKGFNHRKRGKKDKVEEDYS